MMIGVIVMALFAVVLFSVLSWVSVRKAFGELNVDYIPILDRAAELSLDISQARTELFRYANHYEPSPFRIEKHLKKVRMNLEWIIHRQLPQESKNLAQTLLAKTDQFQKSLDLLPLHMNKGDSIQILLTANRLTGFIMTLSSLSNTLRGSLWNHILHKNEVSQKRILYHNAVLSGISLVLIMMLVCGVLLQNRVLQKQVRARTTELERRLNELHKAHENKEQLEAQLHHAQKMEAIGTLAGGIAHDFNNLLMAIQGRASLMLVNKDSTHPDFENLRGIEDHVGSAAGLTRQLLGFARGGKYEVKPTDLNGLIKKENQMFGRTKKEISIKEQYEETLWVVEVDRGQIQQVLLNLYVNAWQAMPEGGNLHVKTRNMILDTNCRKPYPVKPGKYVEISVADTGVGMDKQTRERMFDPFFTTKEMGRGTGLGLASAYGIIKNHGGFIDVSSEKGHGTTFSVYLPASEKKVLENRKPEGDTLKKGAGTVLLVDDEEIIIEVSEQLLKRLGYNVLTALNGKEAIKAYQENRDRIDIVVLDMIMPEMGGGETYDGIKKMNPNVKVLLSSGYSLDGRATEILDRGCNGFIQKPFNLEGLSRKLREILEGHAARC